ncbi:uncharacterized protein LTR77_006766 [Saxophila tyrrhenica]|uniref:DUF218 domain-containing protein n=1 Tax=Saxophila tyrrhenica TaxID=1690608 RepID=A0AAV9P5V1_9PEZI|nr:hypothetical protein LTR77_006766 [Saxophila tyrrhenica]
MANASPNPNNGRKTHLVIVCCHATYTGDGTDTSERNWILQPFQKSDPTTGKASEHETYITHILAGAQAIDNDENALLVFSGGVTASADVSEAQGYRRVLASLKDGEDWHGDDVCTEDVSTDSFQNLLFSILKYRQHVGSFPEQITVITHAFKEKRFLNLHALAIRWPAHRIRINGINPPLTREELSRAERGEAANGYGAFEQDPFGVHPPLSNKRKTRGWDERSWESVLFPGLEAEVVDMFRWVRNGGVVFPSRLPWEE